MASEQLRQREVHKYYQSWLESSITVDSVSTYDQLHLDSGRTAKRTSKDKALTAFAQLGCLRLNVKRAVVTLIATHHQYILAEATKTLSLVSDARVDEAEDEIWFGNASLPRSQGVSESALTPPIHDAVDTDGTTFSAPALVINDLTQHEKYASRDYAGNGVTFYCGVPIVTPAGITIGVYNLTDDKPRDGLRATELRFMCELSTVLMGHLETIKNEAARHRGEFMVFGLGRFVEGASSLYDEPLRSPDAREQPSSPSDNQQDRTRIRNFKGMSVSIADPLHLHQVATAISSVNSLGAASTPRLEESTQSSKRANPESSNIFGEKASSINPFPPGPPSDLAFSRAANILRECAVADGVLFYDAVSANLAKRSSTSGFRSRSHSINNKPLTSLQQTRNNEEPSGEGSAEPDMSDGSENFSSSEAGSKNCRLLGYSVNMLPEWKSASDVVRDRQISEKGLRRLIKRYPQGRLFTFCTDGSVSIQNARQPEGQDSYVRETADSTDPDSSGPNVSTTKTTAKELKRLAPHAQNMIFLPIWDFSKQRWSAGAFLWSRRPDRLVTAQDDLVYLRTFANSIMVEVARLDAATADTAKSTFIANVSHELRSPLHGILGNLDLLSDTSLDDLQQSLVGAIEVCGKMLTDTVDHVLDYSKINQLSRGAKRRKKSSSARVPQLGQSGDLVGKESLIESNFDLAAIVEEVVDIVYGSHIFRSKTASKIVSHVQQHVTHPKSDIQIILDIEYQENWWVYSQPGAIRRVLTNLFENALKYTERGSIAISLSTPTASRSLGSEQTLGFVLAIKDTGRGMSPDFVRNHAFTPFTQESQFSTGAGLGLSIVQQIVNSLGGTIQLHSDVGVGTDIKIHLSVPRVPHIEADRPATSLIDRLRPKTLGLPLRILNADGVENRELSASRALFENSLTSMVKTWFNIEVKHGHQDPDSWISIAVFTSMPAVENLLKNFGSADHFRPVSVITIAANALARAAFLRDHADILSRLGPRLEVISYPVGPQKLGGALLRCLSMIHNSASQGPSRAHDLTNTRSWSSPAIPTASSASQPVASTTDRMLEVACDQAVKSTPGETVRHPSESASSLQSHGGVKIDKDEAGLANIQSLQAINDVKTSDFAPDMRRNTMFSPARTAERAERAERAPALPDTSSPRVLLVDDNEINLNILIACMKRARIPFATAKDGLDALRSFQSAAESNQTFTHILMDITMPVMNGIDSTKEIREFERRQHRSKRHASIAVSAKPSRAVEPAINSEHPNRINHDKSSSHGANNDARGSDPTNDVRTDHQAFIIGLSGVFSENTQHEMFAAGADMFLPKPAKLKELIKIITS